MSRREQLEQMLVNSPDDVFLKYALAMTLAGDGEEEAATAQLAVVNKEHPDHVAAWFQRAQILARLGEVDESREVITAGIVAAQQAGDDHAEGEMRSFLEMLD